MNLEQYISRLNGVAFWREFTFSKNKFKPDTTTELELADNLVWFDKHAFIIQLKQREAAAVDPDAERSWFKKKVIRRATDQIRDSLRFLNQYKSIRIQNDLDHYFEIRNTDAMDKTKIIIYLNQNTLPDDCVFTHFYISKEAGFVHVLAAHDYLGILEKLRVPEDIRRYFIYRQEVTQKLLNLNILVSEADIMGGFIYNEELPSPNSKEYLRRFVQDLNQSRSLKLMTNLHNHIKSMKNPYEYYKIMLEFSRLPRSVWREIDLRVGIIYSAVENKKFQIPLRVTFEDSDCAFMIAGLDPELPSTGDEGEKLRIRGLTKLTHLAMYDAKVSKGIGILISRDAEFIQIDWCYDSFQWSFDADLSSSLVSSNPFLETKREFRKNFKIE